MTSALSFLSFVAVVSASFAAVRQVDQCAPSAPPRCQEAIDGFNGELSRISRNRSVLSDVAVLRQIKSVIEPSLSAFCTSECVELEIIVPFRCNNQSNDGDALASLFCGREGGTFCLVKLLQANISGSPFFPSCANNDNCSLSCQETLRTLRNRTGCCAASAYYISPRVFPYFSGISSQFTICNVSLENRCTASFSGGSNGVHHLSLVFLLVTCVLGLCILS